MRTIRKTTMADLPVLNEIFAYARKFMKENGNGSQWGDNRPPESSILNDIKNGNSYVVIEDEKIIGTFAFINGHDETYDLIEDGSWLNNDAYGVIHRIASAEGASDILKSALEYSEPQVLNMRIDTHEKNKVMQHLLLKYGYTYCGIIYTDDGTSRLAYQKVI